MTGIDELVRETLTSDAATHHAPADLAPRSMAAGRWLRRRRQAGVAAVSLVSVAGVVVGSLALSGALGGGDKAIVTPAHHGPGKHQSVTHHGSSATDSSTGPWWSDWKTDRVYGDKPAQAFFDAVAPGDTITVYASGTTSDGTDFAMYVDKSTGDPRSQIWQQGWNDQPDFGQPGASPVPDAGYSAFESPTLATHEKTNGTAQWLIVVGNPDTTNVAYSPDGTQWQPMDVENGIAVLKLPSAAPAGAQIRLASDTSRYYDGTLWLP